MPETTSSHGNSSSRWHTFTDSFSTFYLNYIFGFSHQGPKLKWGRSTWKKLSDNMIVNFQVRVVEATVSEDGFYLPCRLAGECSVEKKQNRDRSFWWKQGDMVIRPPALCTHRATWSHCLALQQPLLGAVGRDCRLLTHKAPPTVGLLKVLSSLLM